jgi:transcription antitermination factor NusG
LIGFIGGERPVPLRDEEVASILQQIEDKKREGQAQGQISRPARR